MESVYWNTTHHARSLPTTLYRQYHTRIDRVESVYIDNIILVLIEWRVFTGTRLIMLGPYRQRYMDNIILVLIEWRLFTGTRLIMLGLYRQRYMDNIIHVLIEWRVFI